ncbi:hypothetical protein B0O99DRAFT_747638 [Bisporella sp. PMI_857]|nr:hypothetical protein B0O99DRAFT_747638 [Bisporella sp. PMI_857]
MAISTEALVAIINLIVTGPPALLCLYRYLYRWTRQGETGQQNSIELAEQNLLPQRRPSRTTAFIDSRQLRGRLTFQALVATHFEMEGDRIANGKMPIEGRND